MDVNILRRQCQVCGYVAKNPNMLKVHLRVHTGVRPYKCNQCSMAFAQKNNLNRHMAIHGPRFLFQCPIPSCSFTSSRRDVIKPHMMCHEVVHFQCRMCRNNSRAVFFQEGDLRKHIAKVHLNLSRAQQDGLIAVSMLSDAEKAMYRSNTSTDCLEAKTMRRRKRKTPTSADDCEEPKSDANFYEENQEAWAYENSKYNQAGIVSESSAAEDCIDLDEYEYAEGEDGDYDGVEDYGEGADEDFRNISNVVEENQASDIKLEANSMELTYEDHFQTQDNGEPSVDSRKTSHGESPIKPTARCATSTTPSQFNSQFSEADAAVVRHRNATTPLSDETSLQHSVVKTEDPADEERSGMVSVTSLTSLYHCATCDIYFGDMVMHALHAGCHGRVNPLECNTCGVVSQNRYEFATHLARGDHCRRVDVPR